MASTIAFTYDDQAAREQLLNILTNLDPKNTQLVSGLGTEKINAINPSWLIKTLGAVKTNAYIEGSDSSYQNLTDPTRIFNYCQIEREAFQVTDTERAINTAAYNDRFVQEGQDALAELKNDMEFALMRGSLACGTGTAARRLRGIKNSLSLVSSMSGTSLSETILNNYFQLIWDNTGKQIDAVYGDMYIKRKITGFTAGATKNVETTDRRLVNAVDVYQADAASNVRLFAHRYVTVSGDTNHDVVGLVEDLFRVGYLRMPYQEDRPKTGDASKAEWITEFTLVNKHYNGGFLTKAVL